MAESEGIEMDRFKFKGKRKDNDEWITGYFVSSKFGDFIVGEMEESNEEYCNLSFWQPVYHDSVEAL